MIKINLAAKKRSALAGAGRAGLNLSLDGLGGLVGELKELPLRRIILPLIVAFVAYIVSDGYKDSAIKQVDAELTRYQAEQSQLQQEASKLKKYEDLQKSLEADETELKSKLTAIRQLMMGRGDTARILEDISKMTPRNVWLKEFSIQDAKLDIQGLATDFDPVLDFQKALNENVYFSSVEPKQQNQEPDKKLVNFELQGMRKTQ